MNPILTTAIAHRDAQAALAMAEKIAEEQGTPFASNMAYVAEHAVFAAWSAYQAALCANAGPRMTAQQLAEVESRGSES